MPKLPVRSQSPWWEHLQSCVTLTVEILVTPGLLDAESVTVVAVATGQVEADVVVTVTVDGRAADPLAVTVTVDAGPVCVTVEAGTEGLLEQ